MEEVRYYVIYWGGAYLQYYSLNSIVWNTDITYAHKFHSSTVPAQLALDIPISDFEIISSERLHGI